MHPGGKSRWLYSLPFLQTFGLKLVHEDKGSDRNRNFKQSLSLEVVASACLLMLTELTFVSFLKLVFKRIYLIDAFILLVHRPTVLLLSDKRLNKFHQSHFPSQDL